jgi:hypothetical protein
MSFGTVTLQYASSCICIYSCVHPDVLKLVDMSAPNTWRRLFIKVQHKQTFVYSSLEI